MPIGKNTINTLKIINMTNNIHKEIVKRMKWHDDYDAVKFHALNGDHHDHMKLYYATMFEFYKECVDAGLEETAQFIKEEFELGILFNDIDFSQYDEMFSTL